MIITFDLTKETGTHEFKLDDIDAIEMTNAGNWIIYDRHDDCEYIIRGTMAQTFGNGRVFFG